MTQVRIFIIKITFDYHVEWAVENLVVQAVNQLKHNVADFGLMVTLTLQFGDVTLDGPNSILAGLGG